MNVVEWASRGYCETAFSFTILVPCLRRASFSGTSAGYPLSPRTCYSEEETLTTDRLVFHHLLSIVARVIWKG